MQAAAIAKAAKRMLVISIVLFVIVIVMIVGVVLWFRLATTTCPIEKHNDAPTQSFIVIEQPAIQQQERVVSDTVTRRDRAAYGDPLYPPLNRQPRFTEEDTYRMVGYLVNAADKEDTWKLFAREKRRGVGEFYVSSANQNMDVKIPLTNDVVVPPTKLRDIYDIPSELKLNHPMFSSNTTYQVLVNPQADLGASRIYS